MITTTVEFKKKVVEALLRVRDKFDGGDIPFSQKYGIAASIFSRLKGGETEKLLSESKWLTLGRELGVSLNDRVWNTAQTDVYLTIQEDIMFCKKNAKARIYVDECGIGKSYTAKDLSRKLNNCFYVDASQSKSKQLFIREIARVIGVDTKDKYVEVKANLKYWIRQLPEPIIIIDEAGDLEYTAFLELKELWNATEGACGWYLMGADGLRNIIDRGITNKKVGYREIFSRFSESYSSTVPVGKEKRANFYKKLIADVLSVNMNDHDKMVNIVKQCLPSENDTKDIGGLRRAESLLIVQSEED